MPLIPLPEIEHYGRRFPLQGFPFKTLRINIVRWIIIKTVMDVSIEIKRTYLGNRALIKYIVFDARSGEREQWFISSCGRTGRYPEV